MFRSYSKHIITNAGEVPFSPAAYSRFKFGDGRVAADFGRELAEGFIAAHANALLAQKDVVLVPSPYDAIPTASYALAEAFKDVVNRFLYRHGRASLLQSKIHRYKTYTEDYGALSAEERLRLISSDSYHLDRGFLMDRMVIFIDDIRITGSHETIIRRQLEREQITGDFFFLYYGRLENDTIAPDFENHLNYYEVADMQNVVSLFNSDYFVINTRVIKYILKSGSDALETFLATAESRQLQTLTAYAVGNNYHLMDDYKQNLNRIITAIDYGY